jgi:uncharacterized protein DUF4177
MQKWEYKTVEPRNWNTPERDNILNQLGNEGWELVLMDGEYALIFKRPIQISN